MNQFKADRDLLSPNDDGVRGATPSLVIAHTNEGDANGTADDLAAYLQRPAAQASYTMIVDRRGRIVRSNDDNYVPWAAGSPANERGLHICFIGRASQSRAEWLAQTAQLAAAARVVADWCKRYNIPATWLTGDRMRAGSRGIGGHDTTVAAWHSTDHTDPGAGFPRAEFVALVNKAMNGDNNQEDDEMNENDRRMLREVWEQLRGPGGKGWPQLGKNAKGENLSLVDAVAELRAEGDK